MNLRRAGDLIAFIGVLALAGAIGWWETFYKQVSQFVGSKGPLPIECLYQTDGPCALVSSVARWTGVRPYEPMLFWAGAIAVIIGVIMMISGKQPSGANEHSAKPSRIEPHF